jgi:hypothetical protein
MIRPTTDARDALERESLEALHVLKCMKRTWPTEDQAELLDAGSVWSVGELEAQWINECMIAVRHRRAFASGNGKCR